jgi:hypothetical protein
MAKTKTTLSSESTQETLNKRSRLKKPGALIAALFALLLLTLYVLTGGAATQKNVTINSETGGNPTVTITKQAHASGFGLAGGAQSLGYGMNTKNAWDGDSLFAPIVLPTKDNRIFTLKEAAGATLGFVNYEGEGEGNDGVVTTDADRMEGAPKTITKDSEKLTKQRSLETIVTGGFITMIADSVNGLTGLGYNLTDATLKAAYNPHTVCAEATDPDCVFNVTKIMTGDGKSADKGVIGNIFTYFYLPFVGLVSSIVLLRALYQHGLKEQNWKEVGSTALYVLVAGITGLGLLMNAGLVASIPIQAAQMFGGAAMSITTAAGKEGTGANDDGTTSSASAICKSTASNTSTTEDTVLSINSMSCTIWRVIRLDPYARAQFGRPFAKLDVKDPAIAEIIKKAEVDPNVFCVPLRVEGKPEDWKNKTLHLQDGANKTCNLAAYQLYLKTDAQIGNNENKKSHGVDPRWYNLIAVVHADDSLWDAWTYNWSSALMRFMVTTIAMLSFIPIALLILTFAILALLQMLVIAFMMMLLPIVMLIALDKGKGRQYAKAYFSMMLGAIVSYVIYATMLAVGLILLSSIIDTVADLAMVMLFNIILAVAMFFQRKRIFALAHNINPLSNNSVGGKINNMLNADLPLSSLQSGAVGALSGANLAAAWRNRNNIIDPETGKRAGFLGTVSKNMREAGKLAAENDILTRNPNSFRATSIRTRQKMDMARGQELQRLETAKQAEMANVRSDLDNAQKTVDYGEERINTQANVARAAVDNANRSASVVRTIAEDVNRVVLEFATAGTPEERIGRIAFANMFRAEQSMQAALHRERLARATGDLEGIEDAQALYREARAYKGEQELMLEPIERAHYGEELDRMFQADPLLATDKTSINNQFRIAREQDLQAVEAEMATYRAAEKTNQSLVGLAEKEHQLAAVEFAHNARRAAANSPEVKKLPTNEATAYLNTVEEEALNAYLEKHTPAVKDEAVLPKPNLDRLELPIAGIDPAVRQHQEEMQSYYDNQQDWEEQQGGGDQQQPPFDEQEWEETPFQPPFDEQQSGGGSSSQTQPDPVKPPLSGDQTPTPEPKPFKPDEEYNPEPTHNPRPVDQTLDPKPIHDESVGTPTPEPVIEQPKPIQPQQPLEEPANHAETQLTVEETPFSKPKEPAQPAPVVTPAPAKPAPKPEAKPAPKPVQPEPRKEETPTPKPAPTEKPKAAEPKKPEAKTPVAPEKPRAQKPVEKPKVNPVPPAEPPVKPQTPPVAAPTAEPAPKPATPTNNPAQPQETPAKKNPLNPDATQSNPLPKKEAPADKPRFFKTPTQPINPNPKPATQPINEKPRRVD